MAYFRVVCVYEDGHHGSKSFRDAERARGEYRHLKRIPGIVFSGLFGKYNGEPDLHPILIFHRPLPEDVIIEVHESP